jgi:hypothetical protein
MPIIEETKTGEKTTAKRKRKRPYRIQYMPNGQRENEKLGSGIIISHRGSGTKRLRMNPYPLEHKSETAAMTEVMRLARANPGERFEVFTRALSVIADQDGNLTLVDVG